MVTILLSSTKMLKDEAREKLKKPIGREERKTITGSFLELPHKVLEVVKAFH